MAVNHRIAIVQVRQGNVPDVALSSAAMSAAFFTDPQSVATFWADVTFGHVDLVDSAVLPDVDFPATLTTPSAEAIAAAGTAAVVEEHSATGLAGFDSVLLVINPGRFTYANPGFDDSQPSGPANPETIERTFRAACVTVEGRPTIVVPAESVTFTTLYHEVGHALGFGHPVGLLSGANDDEFTEAEEVSDEYGSPYDIMGSSAQADPRNRPSWWSYDSSHPGIPVTGWSGALATRVGPRLSAAHLHHRWPEALGRRANERPLPAGGGETSISTPVRHGRLVVLRTSSDATDPHLRTYLEYRKAEGWDAGLSPSSDTAAEGVVVHVLTQTASGIRLRYAGAVLRSGPDRDVELAQTGMTLTVEEWVEDGALIRLGVHDNARRVTLRLVDETGTLGDPVTVEERRTACRTTYRVGVWKSDYRARVEAAVLGTGGSGDLSGPRFAMRWSVGGTVLAGSAGTVVVPTPGGTTSVAWSLDASGKTLDVSCGSGVATDVPVRAAVVGFPEEGTLELQAPGTYSGIHPDDFDVPTRCIADSIPFNLEWLDVPTAPIRFDVGELDWRVARDLPAWATSRREMLDRVTGLRQADRTKIETFLSEQLVVR
ncbi:hypothetical protein H1Q78_12720 [Cellulosimicrobium cellulans]|uniref:hypothetical protein n=1 Tax=Cellulosimicrobium cellulans TaxID=1710 RepID=UPI001EDA365C|nr:hypothetical protein [Cellulosimicrobium cellulans]UKJ62619.1 hypothetical protein H1Q78_12720 [Cellulosimicrobium cellulans]